MIVRPTALLPGVAAAGYVRARTLDRMIAATALSRGLALVTINHSDFRDIPSLDLIAWEASRA